MTEIIFFSLLTASRSFSGRAHTFPAYRHGREATHILPCHYRDKMADRRLRHFINSRHSHTSAISIARVGDMGTYASAIMIPKRLFPSGHQLDTQRMSRRLAYHTSVLPLHARHHWS